MVMDAVARRHAERDVEAVGVPAGRQPEPTFHGRRDELEPTDQFGRFGAALRPEGPLNWKRRAAVALGLLILGIVLIVESIGKLQTTEVAIVYDKVNKKVSACGRRAGRSGGLTVRIKLLADPLGEGLHGLPPFSRFIKYPAIFSNHAFRDLQCVSKDGIYVVLTISFQYLPDRAHLLDTTKKFRSHRRLMEVLDAAGRSAVHQGCSEFGVQEFQSKRVQVQDRMRAGVQAMLDPLNVKTMDLQLQNILLPAAYTHAVEKKERAREDIQLANNERIQKQQLARANLLESDEQALILLQQARRVSAGRGGGRRTDGPNDGD